MEKRYTALRVIATIYKIMGVLVFVASVLAIGLLVVLSTGNSQALGMYGLNRAEVLVVVIVTTLFSGLLSALGIYAVGEALYLLINLEENTRFTAILLRDRQAQ